MAIREEEKLLTRGDRLKKLRINWVDFVHRRGQPACQNCPLQSVQSPSKRTTSMTMATIPPRPVEQILSQRDAKEAWWELTGALEMSVR